MSNAKKRICVIGLGQFGFELACSLADECEVLALDRKKDPVEQIQERVHRALILDVKDFESLRSVVDSEFDEAIISIAENLESSILATLYLKKIGIKKIWAKASSEDHAAILQAIGADKIIFPERESARRLAAAIKNPNLMDFIPITENYQVIEIPAPAWCVGKNLVQLNLRQRFGVFVMAVKQSSPKKFLFLPQPIYEVKRTDILLVAGQDKDIAELKKAARDED
jgi:trk system potassium uptake protein